jgi:hypothetical protein
MTTTTYIRTAGILIAVLFLLGVSQPVHARHNSGSGYSSTIQKKINALDEDEVEEFEIPVLFGVKLANISPNFGDPRDGGARLHEGLDIMGKLGTPIVSPTEAVVTSTGDGDSSGKYVRTANPGGESFVYMHLDDIGNIKSGDVLKVGDYIGTVGDTGNAKGGPAHLHFEVREGREATDPFPRVEKEFTLEEKIEFVLNMFKDLDDEEDMAEFLVENYTSEFKLALNASYELPEEIEDELKERGIVSTAALVKALADIIATIPKVVTKDLSLGMQGSEVALMQLYLIYEQEGPAASALKATGATGFFGPATEAALKEYQLKAKVVPTGIYNAETREVMLTQ